MVFASNTITQRGRKKNLLGPGGKSIPRGTKKMSKEEARGVHNRGGGARVLGGRKGKNGKKKWATLEQQDPYLKVSEKRNTYSKREGVDRAVCLKK